MSESLFFQDSPLVRVVGQDGKGFTTQVLISSVSPWMGELMSSISPHGEQCIIIPDIAWKDLSGLLIQSEPPEVMSDYLLDLLTNTTDEVDNVIHSEEETDTVQQKNVKGKFKDSVKQEECLESTFKEHVKEEDIGETKLNENVDQNYFYENLLNNIAKLEGVKQMSSMEKEEVIQIESSTRPNQSSLVSRSQKLLKKKIPMEKKLYCEQCELYFSTKKALERHNKMLGHANLKKELKTLITKSKSDNRFKKTKYSKSNLRKILKSPNIHLYDLDKIEGLLSCSECNEKFASVKRLKEHKEKQHPVFGSADLHFSCDYCQFTTTEEPKLKSHRSSIHGDVSESCDMCDKIFTVKGKLYRHQKRDHALVRFPCDQCDYRAKSKHTLKIHFNSIHEKIILTCEMCAKTYTHPRNLYQHQQSVHKGVYFMCDKCDYKGTQKRNLHHHIEKVHEGIRYPCGQCDYRGTTKRKLRYHIANRHGGTMNIITKVDKIQDDATKI